MERVAFSIGSFNIYWYSIFILLAILVASFIIIREFKRKNYKETFYMDLIFYGLLIGILGARIYYVLFNLDYYLTNPSEIIAIWNGGLAIHGGILAASIFAIIYCRKRKEDVIKIIDILIVGLVIGQAIGRWGNFFNQEAYGQIVSLSSLKCMKMPQFIINGMFIDGHYRQPTFLYESISCLICFIVLLITRKYYKNLKIGQLTSIYLIWYGIERLIIESFRADSLMLGSVKIAQIISFLFIILGIIILIKSIKNKKLYNEGDKVCIKK